MRGAGATPPACRERDPSDYDRSVAAVNDAHPIIARLTDSSPVLVLCTVHWSGTCCASVIPTVDHLALRRAPSRHTATRRASLPPAATSALCSSTVQHPNDCTLHIARAIFEMHVTLSIIEIDGSSTHANAVLFCFVSLYGSLF